MHIYKYNDKNKIYRSRLFVKDQDGSICEVPQNRILLRDDELNILSNDINSGHAKVFGENFGEIA